MGGGPEYFLFPNIGYLVDTIPRDVEETLKQEIKKVIDSGKVRDNELSLAGHLQRECLLWDSRSVVEEYVVKLMSEFDMHSGYLGSINILQVPQVYSLDALWVNLQEKHEFNPVHSHAGIVSFVIWIQIPFDQEVEDKFFAGKPDREKRNGKFCFYYTNSLGKIQSGFLDDCGDLQNKICIFPASLSHAVYPFFTSDGVRISVSGNIKFAFKQHGVKF